jgi:cyclopropane-fatty-acyl-phospholipid synthase
VNVTAAEALAPVLEALLGGTPRVTIRCWDGSELGPGGGASAIVIRSPDALRRLLWAPNELGIGRAYVAGDLDIEGDVFDALALRDQLVEGGRDPKLALGWRGWARTFEAARKLGVIGPPLAPPPEEARVAGRLHSRNRDRAAITHHYDVSNDFYRLVLGPSMVYSCGYFAGPDVGLDEAQAAKCELICRKLELRPGMRLLDVGCGWGTMAIHAARHHGVEAVGITISDQQHRLARQRVADAGLEDRVEIRLQDYRDIDDGPFDAISSIGMFEHVGLNQLLQYFSHLRSLLAPQGRLLNHAISRLPGPDPLDRRSFIQRYVFPDGELHEVGAVVTAMQSQGFEVRDVESLREHYARTLRQWIANLEAHWDEAVDLAGAARARIWRLYMAGSALNFEANRASIHQVLGVNTPSDGRSAMPATRQAWLGGVELVRERATIGTAQ